jgi:hypothetical protein
MDVLIFQLKYLHDFNNPLAIDKEYSMMGKIRFRLIIVFSYLTEMAE